jgi:hypothetical protein
MKHVTHSRYRLLEDAEEVSALLIDNRIECIIDNDHSSIDDNITGGTDFISAISLKVKPEDFAKVDQLLIDKNKKEINNIASDHYLFDFSTPELIDVLKTYDKWSEMDVLLAQKILNDRGENYPEEIVNQLKRDRMEKLRQPEGTDNTTLYMGYLCAIFGGLIGIFIGHHLYHFKKTLPNGERELVYTHETRQKGLAIYYLSILSFIVWAVVAYTLSV